MDDLLKLELRVLLLRHGRRNIIEALALLTDQNPADIEREIDAAEKRKANRKQKSPSATEIALEVCRGKPETAEMLMKLATRYENRTFLPQLRDVKRFLERSGVKHRSLRSRADGARQVIMTLSQLGTDDLNRLASAAESHDESDFALLAREIMGGRPSGREVPDRKT